MNKKTTIVVRTQFEGGHSYPKAPQVVNYLRYPHRHVFHIELELQVNHDDRELEFIIVKRNLNEFLHSYLFDEHVSCEQIGHIICEYVFSLYGNRNARCCVYEDNENGGCVYYEF